MPYLPEYGAEPYRPRRSFTHRSVRIISNVGLLPRCMQQQVKRRTPALDTGLVIAWHLLKILSDLSEES